MTDSTPAHPRASSPAGLFISFEGIDGAGKSSHIEALHAAFVAAGLSLRDAMPLANRAGGLVVGKFGTATVSYDELFAGA